MFRCYAVIYLWMLSEMPWIYEELFREFVQNLKKLVIFDNWKLRLLQFFLNFYSNNISSSKNFILKINFYQNILTICCYSNFWILTLTFWWKLFKQKLKILAYFFFVQIFEIQLNSMVNPPQFTHNSNLVDRYYWKKA